MSGTETESKNEQFRHSELTKLIIGTFYEVYNELGHGFLESVYENSLCIALRDKGLEVHQQIAVPVWFRALIGLDHHTIVSTPYIIHRAASAPIVPPAIPPIVSCVLWRPRWRH